MLSVTVEEDKQGAATVEGSRDAAPVSRSMESEDILALKRCTKNNPLSEPPLAAIWPLSTLL